MTLSGAAVELDDDRAIRENRIAREPSARYGRPDDPCLVELGRRCVCTSLSNHLPSPQSSAWDSISLRASRTSFVIAASVW
ncbi:MAG: hypothetical protein OXG35_11430 [Acidobacteria bacterium]|nr:hypothetical protein [Acidobacteriota bacterium]